MIAAFKPRLIAILALLAGCDVPAASQQAAERDQLTQVSIINALMLGQYDGLLSMRELLHYGDFGLGTFDHLDGEMIVLDGKVYQAKSDGTVADVDARTTTPFALVTPFAPDGDLPCPATSSLVELEIRLDHALPAQNTFIAIRIDVDLQSITFRSVPRQEPPYAPLAEVTKNQKVWAHESVTGTLVGVRCPKWVEGINVPGYHWHFVSSDRTLGGHVLDCDIKSGTITYDQCDSWFVKLTEAQGKDLSQDLSRELEQVEKLRAPAHPAPSQE